MSPHLYGVPFTASSILSQGVVPIKGYHRFCLGRLIFLPQSFLNNAPRSILIIEIKLPQSSEVKSISKILLTVFPSALAAPAAAFAILTAAITSPATPLILSIAEVIPFNIRHVTALTASLIALLTTCITLLIANDAI